GFRTADLALAMRQGPRFGLNVRLRRQLPAPARLLLRRRGLQGGAEQSPCHRDGHRTGGHLLLLRWDWRPEIARCQGRRLPGILCETAVDRLPPQGESYKG